MADHVLCYFESPSFNISQLEFVTSALNDTLLQSIVCGSTGQCGCVALCPNQDISGLGVRLAFYIQSFVSAMLVIFSPADSVATAWAGALLNAAIVIAAFVQKAQNTLTLHHATLVLNFATLSCIGSLAVAPTLPIWRMKPEAYYQYEQRSHALVQPSESRTTTRNSSPCHDTTTAVPMNLGKHDLKRAQERARLILTVALLFQVLCQWSWAIALFVWWQGYSQPECNMDMEIVMFYGAFNVGRHNGGRPFVVWPIWLLFNLAVTLGLTLLLVFTSAHRAQLEIVSTGMTSPYGIEQWRRLASAEFNRLKEPSALFVFSINLFSAILWTMFLASSEKQKRRNRMFDGENDITGFGQLTAIFVSIAPVSSLIVALYKYPARQRWGYHDTPAPTPPPRPQVTQHPPLGEIDFPTPHIGFPTPHIDRTHLGVPVEEDINGRATLSYRYRTAAGGSRDVQ